MEGLQSREFLTMCLWVRPHNSTGCFEGFHLGMPAARCSNKNPVASATAFEAALWKIWTRRSRAEAWFFTRLECRWLSSAVSPKSKIKIWSWQHCQPIIQSLACLAVLGRLRQSSAAERDNCERKVAREERVAESAEDLAEAGQRQLQEIYVWPMPR